MSDSRDILKQLVKEQITDIQRVSGNRIGFVNQLNPDGTAIVLVDGTGVVASILHTVVLGQEVIVMPDNAGGYRAAATHPPPPPTIFERPVFFAGGTFRVCGSPPGAGVGSPYEQFVPGYPTFSGQHLYVGVFQEITNSNVYVLQDPDRVVGNFQYNRGTLSKKGGFYAVDIFDNDTLNVILQVWEIGSTLTSAATLDQTNKVFSLRAKKVTEVIISTSPVTEDLGQYPMQGRFLKDRVILGPTYTGPGPAFDPGTGLWVLGGTTTPFAWCPNGNDPGPQYEIFPDSTHPPITRKALGITLNTVLDSGEFCNSSDAVNTRGESYDVQGSASIGVLDLSVDDNGILYWVQRKDYKASVISNTPGVYSPIVPVGTNVFNNVDGGDAILPFTKGAGYYVFEQEIGGAQNQIGFWPYQFTNTLDDTSVEWNTPSDLTYNPGGLFFFVNQTKHVMWKPIAIFDIVRSPLFVVSGSNSPVVIKQFVLADNPRGDNPIAWLETDDSGPQYTLTSDTSVPGVSFKAKGINLRTLLAWIPVNPSTDPNFTGNFNWAFMAPFTGANLPFVAQIVSKTVHFQSLNYNTTDIGSCTLNYLTLTINPSVTDTQSIAQNKGIKTLTAPAKDFLTVGVGSTNTGGTIAGYQEVPGSPPPTKVTISNPIADFQGVGGTTNPCIILGKSKGNILDQSQHAFDANSGPPISFTPGSKLKVSPGQVDPTLIRIYNITGVALS